MADAHWTLRSPGERADESAPAAGNPWARERLARLVREKQADGYRVESQTATRAVLVKPPRRLLGITAPGGERREVVSLDRRGHPVVRDG